ncbi:MAG: hypothetical protein GY906_05125 [bacterium]|nr:hypothetical protein [bacterium]
MNHTEKMVPSCENRETGFFSVIDSTVFTSDHRVHSMVDESSARVVVCRGALAAEQRLIVEIDSIRPRRVEECGTSVRVIVPSRSLRLHIASRLVAALGSLAGVTVQTAQRFASEVLEAVEEPQEARDAYFELLVRRFAPLEPILNRDLADLEGGYDVLHGVIRDLFDAGYCSAHFEPLRERLHEIRAKVGRERIDRATAIIRLATVVADGLEAAQTSRSADAPARASDLIRSGVLPQPRDSKTFVYGFADATGVTSDFLETLVKVNGATVILDRPPDPVGSGDDPGCVFLDRLSLRFGATLQERDTSPSVVPRINLVEAANPEEEARWLAVVMRHLLDGGATPESVLIVVRDLDSWAPRLRRHLTRMGVPFSGIGATVHAGSARVRCEGLTEIVRRGAEMEVERWAEIRDRVGLDTDLLLGLRVLGALRMGDIARITPEEDAPHGVKLPFTHLDEDSERFERPRLATNTLAAAVTSAREMLCVLESWSRLAGAESHARMTRSCMDALGWEGDSTEYQATSRVVATLVSELPSDLDVERDEWLRLIDRRARTETDVPIGGSGGGVQLVTLVEARGRTAERLYLLGAARGTLPRIMPDDPLLPDAVRGSLAYDVLPEMPVKARSGDEEKYLFAQLLSAAPVVTLSWSRSLDGRRQAPSPFIDRLRVVHGLEPITARQELECRLGEVPRPAFEHAIRSGLDNVGRPDLDALEKAVSEGRILAEVNSALPAHGVASAKRDLAAAVEPGTETSGPGPWAGLVGNVHRTTRQPVAVTRLEGVAKCPWQAFITRRLNIAPMPDPLHTLPELTGALIGNLVHDVLDEIVRQMIGENGRSVEAMVLREAQNIEWPRGDELDALVARLSHEITVDAGLTAYGVAPLLATMVGPYLEVAERVAGFELGGVLGSEVQGTLEFDGLTTQLAFRVDRLDRIDNRLIFIDYKTGKPVVKAAKTQKTLDKNLRKGVARGELLQGVVYALASKNGSGCYLSLKPETGVDSDASRWTVIHADDREVVEAFEKAVVTVWEGWEAGAMVPRVENAGKPGSQPDCCAWCSVSEACIRSDSGRRQRLSAWLNQDVRVMKHDDQQKAHSLWWIGCDQTEGSS